MSNVMPLLRKVAEKATPGPWVCRSRIQQASDSPAYVDAPDGFVAKTHEVADAEYIAAFDPLTVLGMLDVLGACLILTNHWPENWGADDEQGLMASLEGFRGRQPRLSEWEEKQRNLRAAVEAFWERPR